MDELRSFYLDPGRSKVVKLRGAQTSGRRLTKEDTADDMSRKVEHRQSVLLRGTEYARETKQNEIERNLKIANDKERWESISGGLESLENLSTFTSQQNLGELTEEAMTEVYSKYSFQTKEETTKLAINEYKQQIMYHIQYQPVVIIEGPTGCGKTTQVPQWILDDCYQKRKHCKVIVTQPRRIAAISIAKRVAQERGWDVGGLVGYQVGLENKTSTDSRITYATTGILLQKLVASKTMNEYTHIILDEVHERGQEMDFLLLVVRRLHNTVSRNVKVILMSATFNYAEFADYFQQQTTAGLEPSACVRVVKKQPMFNVKTFYLNHLDKFGNLETVMRGSDQPSISPDMHKLVIKLVNAFEFIDKQEEGYSDASQADLPSVLVFLPGINEIEDLYSMLTSQALRSKVAGPDCAKYKWCVLPLHSTITADEQVRVFQRAPPGTRKIILSTNIAESSITVPDVKYVIDFCLMKILVADEQTNFTSLQLHWASRNNCEQRAGRAGRVREGRIYRLVTDKFYQSLPQECPPEICRCPLERLVLLAKMMQMGPPADILGLAMNPPDLSNIHRTILVLKEIGAMRKTMDGEHSDIDGDITYLGRIMAKLPLDVRVSKLIMLGHIYGCLNETVIMAAAMSVKNIFNNPFMERLHAYNSKLTWANGSTSDCTAFLNVYRVWSHLRQQQFFKQRGNSMAAWAQRFYVQARALSELDELVRELHCRLAREGIEQQRAGAPWNKNSQTLLLKILIAGAFYPHYFVLSAGKPELERDAVKTLGGLDPRTTVYLTDFPVNQPGSVYASSIKKIVHELTGDEPRVTFDSNSAKVYLTFKEVQTSDSQKKESAGNPTIPGNVVLPVYKAVKMRHLCKSGTARMPTGMGPGIRLALLAPDKAHELALELEASKLDINKNMMVPRLPELDDTHFPLVISQFVNCGRFWVQHDDSATADELRGVHAELNSRPLLAHTAAAVPGELFAAPYRDETGTRLYRVRVMKVMPEDMIWVLYIDYGGYGRVNAGSLRSLPLGLCQHLPPMAMECVLAKVAPSPLLDAHGQWTRDATHHFQQLIKDGHLIGKVYSVVKGVVAIKLLADHGRRNVNKELIAKNYAHACEEGYESMSNHLLRKTASELDRAQKRAFNSEQVELAYQDLREPAPPSAEKCVAEVQLKGPFSPLESKLHSLMFAGGKQVSIEWNSVNSVLLYTEPQEIYQRLLVAGAVGTNEDAGRLTLRHTTLMPNIPGLPAIMALLFCPTTELRRDSTATRYVSALCGLGSTEDGVPLFPDHDLLVNIDVDFSIDDIVLINHIRHLMDFTMYTGPGQDTPSADDAARAKVPGIIYENLMELLTRARSTRPAEAVPRAWDWGSAPAAELLELTEPGLQERAVAYPLHAPLELRAQSEDQLRTLKRDHDQLVLTVKRMPVSSTQEVECTLCCTGSMSLLAMRTHLASRSHREKKEIFRMFET